jgi:hypothetical protein
MLPQKLIFFAVAASILGVMLTASTTPSDSGIYGQALLGPICPVVRVGDPSCADRPYQVSVAVYLVRPNTAVPTIYPTPPGSVPTVRKVTTLTTDSSGKFRVNLRPGTYVLRKEGPTTPPSLPDVLANVTAGQFSEVNLPFDSGIR